MSIVIAIDGPAGAGKSTVAKMLAKSLGLVLLDTGAMYRAVALLDQRAGRERNDVETLAAIAKEIDIRFEPGDPQLVFVNGEDVTNLIRTLEIGQLASAISVHSPIRRELVARQQALIDQGGFVLEGRDVTTVVAPKATLKIFLTASIEERARRRWLELRANDEAVRLQDVVKEVVERDHRDYTRADSPLTLAEDATIVESFGLTPEEVCARIVAMLP